MKTFQTVKSYAESSEKAMSDTTSKDGQRATKVLLLGSEKGDGFDVRAALKGLGKPFIEFARTEEIRKNLSRL